MNIFSTELLPYGIGLVRSQTKGMRNFKILNKTALKKDKFFIQSPYDFF